eukprot:g2531.t1
MPKRSGDVLASERLREAAVKIRKKRKKMKLPSRETIRSFRLSKEQRSRFLEEVTDVSYRTVKLIQSIAEASSMKERSSELRTNTIKPPLFLYRESSDSKSGTMSFCDELLWQEVQRAATALTQGVNTDESSPRANGEVQNTTSTSMKNSDDDDDDVSQTFGDFYRQTITTAFGDDLDKLRSGSDFQGTQKDISLLVDAIESGTFTFSDWDKRIYANSFVMPTRPSI